MCSLLFSAKQAHLLPSFLPTYLLLHAPASRRRVLHRNSLRVGNSIMGCSLICSRITLRCHNNSHRYHDLHCLRSSHMKQMRAIPFLPRHRLYLLSPVLPTLLCWIYQNSLPYRMHNLRLHSEFFFCFPFFGVLILLIFAVYTGNHRLLSLQSDHGCPLPSEGAL